MTLNIPIPVETVQQIFGTLPQAATPAAAFDLKSLVGLSGIPFVESGVEYLKDQWELPGKLSPLVAIILAILLNVVLALALKNDVLSSLYIGFFTGLFSSVWHEQTRPTE